MASQTKSSYCQFHVFPLRIVVFVKNSGSAVDFGRHTYRSHNCRLPVELCENTSVYGRKHSSDLDNWCEGCRLRRSCFRSRERQLTRSSDMGPAEHEDGGSLYDYKSAKGFYQMMNAVRLSTAPAIQRKAINVDTCWPLIDENWLRTDPSLWVLCWFSWAPWRYFRGWKTEEVNDEVLGAKLLQSTVVRSCWKGWAAIFTLAQTLRSEDNNDANVRWIDWNTASSEAYLTSCIWERTTVIEKSLRSIEVGVWSWKADSRR